MIEKTIELLKKYQDRNLILSCSGGVDSMVLLHIMATHGFKFSVVHVNYQKRGEASDADMELVRKECLKYSIELNAVNYNGNRAFKTKNFQDNAREFRRDIVEQINPYYDTINVIAQHADDQVETFFLQLSRKSGIMGLAGMLIEDDKLIRPLLHWSKVAIYAYAKEHKINWNEDESNKSSNYVRNQWRNQLIPLMEQKVPHVKDAVLTLVSAFQQTQSHIEKQVKAVVMHIHDTNRLQLSLFEKLPSDYLFEIWRQLKQEPTHFESFIKLKTSQKGKHLVLKGTYDQVIKEDNYLFFQRKSHLIKHLSMKMEVVENLPTTFDKNEIYLDKEKISGKLNLRKWQKGDRIAPIGMKGSKLVSDVITDCKVPHHQRQDIHVLEDEEKIIWIPKLKISRKAIASTKSAIILRVTVQ